MVARQFSTTAAVMLLATTLPAHAQRVGTAPSSSPSYRTAPALGPYGLGSRGDPNWSGRWHSYRTAPPSYFAPGYYGYGHGVYPGYRRSPFGIFPGFYTSFPPRTYYDGYSYLPGFYQGTINGSVGPRYRTAPGLVDGGPTRYLEQSFVAYIPGPFLYADQVRRQEQRRQARVVGSSTAYLELRVPEDAEVWFQGVKMSQTGPLRKFVSPALQPGGKYSYEVRVVWTQDGRPVSQTRTVAVRAGDQLTLDFTQSE